MLRTWEIAATAYMESYIVGFNWMKRFAKSNIFRVRFSWEPSEYCINVTHVLRNFHFTCATLAQTYIS